MEKTCVCVLPFPNILMFPRRKVRFRTCFACSFLIIFALSNSIHSQITKYLKQKNARNMEEGLFSMFFFSVEYTVDSKKRKL